MSNLVIVAIPDKDDYVHKISSEKVPHTTLLFLGDVASKVRNLDKILDFVGHAASQSLFRFGLEVDHRGELGPDKADVLFFSKDKWSGFETLKDYRSYLLQETNIRTAYDSTEQYSEWLPHLTLGYPATPAKEDTRDFPGISYVTFDRIAVWFGDYEGIEFPLKKYEWDMEVAMSDVSPVDFVDDYMLTHFGAKGMKWGVRKSRPSGAQSVSVTDKKKKLKTKGGSGHAAHPDAINSRTTGQIGKKSGLKSLSNKQLQEFNNRLNLEQNYKRLAYNDKNAGKRFVDKLLLKRGPGMAEAGGKAALNHPKVRLKMAKGAAALAIALP